MMGSSHRLEVPAGWPTFRGDVFEYESRDHVHVVTLHAAPRRRAERSAASDYHCGGGGCGGGSAPDTDAAAAALVRAYQGRHTLDWVPDAPVDVLLRVERETADRIARGTAYAAEAAARGYDADAAGSRGAAVALLPATVGEGAGGNLKCDEPPRRPSPRGLL